MMPEQRNNELGGAGRLRAWLLGFAIWTALAVLSVLQSALYFVRDSRAVPWEPVIVDRFADWYTCAIFTPVFFMLVRAIPWDRASWWRPIGAQSLVVIACVPVKYVLYLGIIDNLIPGYRESVFGRVLLGSFITEVMAFGAMLAVVHAVELNRRVTLQKMQAARLETRLAEARLEALTAQLQPHFLFNTLHAISTLMHRDVESADTMLARLGDLLRQTLDDSDRAELPLGDELKLLDAYLDIARVRFEDRLTVDVQVEPQAASALVPRFVLQPLVENALQHGIGSREGPARVTVRAQRAGDRLHLAVADDGDAAHLGAAGFPREGVGLSNTRERLRERYGRDHTIQLSRGVEGGLQIILDIPFNPSIRTPAERHSAHTADANVTPAAVV